MLNDRNLPEGLSLPLRTVGDKLSVPITIADPNIDDTPLVFVNRAFERLTQYTAAEVLGRNCRFLQGPLTDRTVTVELAQICQSRSSDSVCLINYRKDGSIFFNLLAIQPIDIDQDRTLLMGCQLAFQPTQTAGTLARTGAMIDQAQRQIRFGIRSGPLAANIHDTYRLDATAMRFEAAFARVRNTLIKNKTAIMQQSAAFQKMEALQVSSFAGPEPADSASRLR